MIKNTGNGRQLIELTGQRFGILTVVGFAGMKNHRAYWICRCDCGSPDKEIVSEVLRKGMSKSCGCLRAKVLREMTTTHGLSKTAEYKIWKGIVTRCTNKNCRSYKRYGGRGILMCNRWRTDFMAFLADMGKRPTKRHSIDRIENDKGYEPGNCRWAISPEQRRNTSTNLMIEHNGETLCVSDWAVKTGLHKNTIRNRLLLGWSAHDALTTPSRLHAPI